MYRRNLERLSEYGLEVDVLHGYFAGDDVSASTTLNQIERILKNYADDVNSIKLSFVDSQLDLEVDIKKGFKGRRSDLNATIEYMELFKRPDVLHHKIIIFFVDKDKYEARPKAKNCFDLPAMKNQSSFKELVSKVVPEMNNDDVEYFSDLLTECSNHPFSALNKMSVCFEKVIFE